MGKEKKLRKITDAAAGRQGGLPVRMAVRWISVRGISLRGLLRRGQPPLNYRHGLRHHVVEKARLWYNEREQPQRRCRKEAFIES